MTELPMIFILAGLAAYTVLAGADFGAGLWTLLAGRGETGHQAMRHHARHAMGPVWEANHVWLIFVLVVCWTAYPVAFGSITSTLAVPLFAAAVGIILRGAAYALRGRLDGAPGERPIEYLFALSSILTPFALGTVAGAIATGRVPVGNAAGDLVTSWLNPTSLLIGALAVAAGGYLAAVYLAADARRTGSPRLEHDFRVRALAAGGCAGALALAGLIVARFDAPALFTGLTTGAGAVMVALSGLAGIATLLLVWRERFEPARASAALAVAAVIAGWALAQRPRFLPGLTLDQAAAGTPTLRAIVVAVAAGAVVLLPSLILLFRLFLRGDLDHGAPGEAERRTGFAAERRAGRRRLGGFAVVTLSAGLALALLAEPGLLLGLGVGCLIAGAVATFALATAEPERP
ncbi:cytochrome d ubiquinol oxidase subunit II [Nonomuraea sp. NPDC049419]|uniref:cytochrome d ubiquinol oxidase subunit II n=1 Tax=Nonomuraea sp. NPDC049419 TaxID=3155772 RepID=UPI003439CEC0